MRFPEDECVCDHTADEHAMSLRSECLADECECPGFEIDDDSEREADL